MSAITAIPGSFDHFPFFFLSKNTGRNESLFAEKRAREPMSVRNDDAEDVFDEALSEDDAAVGAAGAAKEEGTDAQSDPGEYGEDEEYDDEEDEECDDEEDEYDDEEDEDDYEYHGGIDQSEHDADADADAGAEGDAVTETPQAEFRCVFTRGGSVQGKLLLLRTRLVFMPHFFSTARVSLGYATIVQIHKRNTALIFPNAIEFVTADGQRYLFTSFIARDQAYATICNTLRTFTEGGHVMEFSMSEHSERIASDAEGDTPAPAPAPSGSASPASSPASSPALPESTPLAPPEGTTAVSPAAAPPVGSPSSLAATSPPATAAGLLAVSVPTTPVVQGDAAVVVSAAEREDLDGRGAVPRIDPQTTPAQEEAAAEAAPVEEEEEPVAEAAMPEVQEACAKHFSAELHKAPEWRREDVALPPARVHGVLFGAGTHFWHDVYGDMQYTNIECSAWAPADGCRCLQRSVEFDTVVTHSLVGTKNCHVRNTQFLTRPAPDVLEFVTQTHLGPELPYSTSYYAEAFLRIAPAAAAPARGATVTIGFRTVFVKSVFVRGIIEKSAIAGLYPLYEKFLARLRTACEAAAAASPSPSVSPAAGAGPQSRTPRRLRKGRKRAGAQKGTAAATATATNSAAPAPAAQPVAGAAGAGAATATPAPAASSTQPAAAAAAATAPKGVLSQVEWLQQLVRIAVVPLRTPSLVRDLVAALLLSLLVSGFVTSALRVQVEAQGAQLRTLAQQVAELQARLAADSADDGVCLADAEPPVVPSSPAPSSQPLSAPRVPLTATLREEDVARILAFLGEARELADTLGATAAPSGPSAVPRTARGALPQPSKQERWTTVLVAALILVTALAVIFFRTA